MGNCLDYTNTPENNLHPGEANFARLRSIYIAGENNALEVTEDENVQVTEKRDSSGRYLRRVIIRHLLLEKDFNLN